jgi:hypothetical protein
MRATNLLTAAVLITFGMAGSAPAQLTQKPTLLIADQEGSVELARTSRLKCVRRGRCWVPCRGETCRKACFRTWWSCSVR